MKKDEFLRLTKDKKSVYIKKNSINAIEPGYEGMGSTVQIDSTESYVEVDETPDEIYKMLHNEEFNEKMDKLLK